MNRCLTVCALILAVAVFGPSASPAIAQAEPTLLVIPAGTWGATAERLGWIDVYANGAPCGRVVFAPAGDVSVQEQTLQLDAPGQPEECTTNGARLTFIEGRGHLLDRSLIVAAGQVNVLGSLPPRPLSDPDPSAFSVMIVVIPHQAREQADTTLGMHVVDAHADGELCLALTLGPDSWLRSNGDAVVGLGKPDQAAVCGRPGALVTLRTRSEDSPAAGEGAFLVQFRLAPGATYLLTSFAPVVLRDQRDVLPPEVGTGLAGGRPPSAVASVGSALAVLGAAGFFATTLAGSRRATRATRTR